MNMVLFVFNSSIALSNWESNFQKLCYKAKRILWKLHSLPKIKNIKKINLKFMSKEIIEMLKPQERNSTWINRHSFFDS